MTRRLTCWVALPLLALAACENPVQVADHEEAEVGGVVILAEATGAVLARSLDRGPFDVPLVLSVGESLEVEVLFLNAADPDNLDRAFHPHQDEGQSLRVTVEHPAVATFTVHGEHGDFHGVAGGTTTATVHLYHGDHPDFTSGPLTVTVE